MEFWLSFNNMQEYLQLPVPPPEFTLQTGSNIITVNVNSIGEIGLIGKSKIKSIDISSFFPAQEYSFCQYRGFPEPYECVKMIEKWRDSGKPIRFTITGTPINMAASIESFPYSEKGGTRDVYFTLSLKEYKFLTVSSISPSSTAQTSTSKRPVTVPRFTTYTVKDGDTLRNIVLKAYGTTSKLSYVAGKNNIKNTKLIYPGQVIKL